MRAVAAILAVFLQYALPLLVVVTFGFLLMALFGWWDRYRSRHAALQEFLYRVRLRLLSWLYYFEDRADDRYRRSRRGDSIWKEK